MKPSDGRFVSLDITVETVRPGDSILIGGKTFVVAGVRAVKGQPGCKLVQFATGEQFLMTPHTQLAALRLRKDGGRQTP